MSDILSSVIEPFEIDPRELAVWLLHETPWWRPLRRRRLRREITRLGVPKP